jgi:hypothetical protein
MYVDHVVLAKNFKEEVNSYVRPNVVNQLIKKNLIYVELPFQKKLVPYSFLEKMNFNKKNFWKIWHC